MSLRALWLEHVLLPLEVRHLSGPRCPRCAPDAPVVLCLAKDAGQHIGAFIAHYRALGAGHIVLLDNGSADDTVAQASPQPGVSVFQTRLPFRNNNRQMRRYLLRRFAARGHWALVVDVDELFDYPCSQRLRLPGLLGYLRKQGYSAMVAYQLDMLPDRPLAELDPATPLAQACPCYDISAVRKRGYFEPDGYGGERWVAHNRLGNLEIRRYVGGIRAQAFDLPEVYLIKHPLVLNDGHTRLVHQHFVDHAAVADISGVLRHYKFVPGFAAKVDAAVASQAYADGSWEYQRYQKVLQRDHNLDLRTPTARVLRGMDELVDQGFVQVTKPFLDWVDKTACVG